MPIKIEFGFSMYSNNCEQAFDDFLDRREYDQAKNELSAIVRIVFLAGCCWWGNTSIPEKYFGWFIKKFGSYMKHREM